jgi:RNA polymerase sigma-70 factor (ECF subfamily)
MPQPLTNNEMVELCKIGDPNGYAMVYHAYVKEVYNTIYRLVSSRSEAEEIVQDSFIAVFQSLKREKPIEQLGPWIKRIATYKAIDFIRKKKIRFVELEEELTTVEGEGDEIDEALFADQLVELRRAIDELPQAYRVIVQLHVFENIPQAEIARMLGIESNTVNVQYHRAKQKIIQAIKKTKRYEI